MIPLRFSQRLNFSPFFRIISTRVGQGDFAMAAQLLKTPRQFAPLKGDGDKIIEGAPKLKGVVFDVDGTLW
jgi:hypothetical protein